MKTYIGKEKIFDEQGNAVAQVNDFWRWSGSDLLNNTTYRGMLAEFLVARALNIDTIAPANWELYDLLYNDIKIEVKSSAYIQSWKQKKLYSPRFDIHKTASAKKRISDIYVFCLLKEKNRNVINPLDLNQWDFYIVKTSVIDIVFHNQKSVALSMITPVSLCVKFRDLKKSIDVIGKTL